MKKLAVVLAGLVLTLAALGHLAPAPAADPAATPAASAHLLFSRSAMRRARVLIQLRMLELREERLECLRAVLVRRLPPDLLPAEDANRATGGHGAAVKQSPPPSARFSRSALGESEECSWISGPPRRHRPTA